MLCVRGMCYRVVCNAACGMRYVVWCMCCVMGAACCDMGVVLYAVYVV